jgi:hypothetical protein
MNEEQDFLVNELTRAPRNYLPSRRLLIILLLTVFISFLLFLIWHPYLTGIQYPKVTEVANCTYSPLEAEINVKYSYARLQFNDCLIATDSLSEVVNWYEKNSIGPFGIKEEYKRWENPIFGISMTRRVYFMPPSCLIKRIGSCASDTSSNVGIYSWVSFILYNP